MAHTVKRYFSDEWFQLGFALVCVSGVLLIRLSVAPVEAPPIAPPEKTALPQEALPPVATPQPLAAPQSVDHAFEKNAQAGEVAKQIVDPASSSLADPRTINEAITKASPGDVIELKPGTYKEKITFDKNIVLRGLPTADGKIGVRIENTGSETIFVQSGSVRIENVMIVLETEPKAASPAAILQTGGSLSLYNVLAFTAGTATAAAFSLREGEATVEKSEFSGHRGIEQLAGKLKCTDCVANGNKEEGAIFFNQSGSAQFSTVLKNFRADKNGTYGFAVMNQARVEIDGCKITESKTNGVLVNGTGVVSVRNCEFSRNQEVGMVATDTGEATILASKFLDNGLSGLAAMGTSKVSVRESELSRNGEFGFASLEKGAITAENNIVSGNRSGASYSPPDTAAPVATQEAPARDGR